MSTTGEINIQNVGPIEHLRLPLPAGGVVVLRGRNGRGKSTALEAIDAAAGAKRSLSVRDRQLRGEVSAFGAKITIGRSTRRSGEAEVHTLEGKFSVADLVDPGLIDHAAADARRLKALVQLSGAKPDPTLFYDLLGGPERMAELVSPAALESDDLVAMAARIKRDLEAKARASEETAENFAARAKAAREAVSDVDLDAESDPAALQAALEAAVREDGRLRAGRSAYLAARESTAAAKRQLSHAEAQYAGPTLERASFNEEQLKSLVSEAEATVQEIAAQLRAAEEEFALARNDYAAAISARKQAEHHAAVTKQLIDQIEASAPPNPSDAEIDAAAGAVTQARQAVEQGALIRRAREQIAAAEQAEAEQQTAERMGARLREAAKGTDDVLTALVGRLGSALRVEAGRLVLDTTRGETYFAELSHGERWRLALDVAIDAVGSGGELTIPQDAWEGLDPINRRAIADHLAATGVVAYTAEATADEELTAMVYE